MRLVQSTALLQGADTSPDRHVPPSPGEALVERLFGAMVSIRAGATRTSRDGPPFFPLRLIPDVQMGPQRVRDQALVDFQGHLQRPKRATFEADN